MADGAAARKKPIHFGDRLSIGRGAFIVAFIIMFATLISGLTVSGPARAEARDSTAESDDPAVFVRSIADRATVVLANQSLAPVQRVSLLHDLFRTNVEVDRLGRFVLGRYWRKATPEQRDEFSHLFEAYIISTFAQRIEDYSGERLKVGASRIVGEGAKRAVVTSQIIRPEGPPIRADWQLLRGEKKWWIVDVIVEGVSLALTQRSEFGAVIKSNGGRIEALLVTLRAKTSAMTAVASESLAETQ